MEVRFGPPTTPCGHPTREGSLIHLTMVLTVEYSVAELPQSGADLDVRPGFR